MQMHESPVVRRTPIGDPERKLTIGDAALIGIVWAVSLDEAGSLLKLHCPPIALRWLAKIFHYRCRNIAMEDVNLAYTIYHIINESIPYTSNNGLQGNAFEDLSLIAEVCRQSLLADSKCQVCRRLPALLRSNLKRISLAGLIVHTAVTLHLALRNTILGKRPKMIMMCSLTLQLDISFCRFLCGPPRNTSSVKSGVAQLLPMMFSVRCTGAFPWKLAKTRVSASQVRRAQT